MFSKSRKEMGISAPMKLTTLNRHDQRRIPSRPITAKNPNDKNEETVLIINQSQEKEMLTHIRRQTLQSYIQPLNRNPKSQESTG